MEAVGLGLHEALFKDGRHLLENLRDCFIFFLEKLAQGVEMWRSLKPAETLSAFITIKCQGTRCNSGTVAPL